LEPALAVAPPGGGDMLLLREADGTVDDVDEFDVVDVDGSDERRSARGTKTVGRVMAASGALVMVLGA